MPLFSPWNTTQYRLTGPSYAPDQPPLTRQAVKSAFELPFGATAAGRAPARADRPLVVGRRADPPRGREHRRRAHASRRPTCTGRTGRTAGSAGAPASRPRAAGSRELIARATDRARPHPAPDRALQRRRLPVLGRRAPPRPSHLERRSRDEHFSRHHQRRRSRHHRRVRPAARAPIRTPRSRAGSARTTWTGAFTSATHAREHSPDRQRRARARWPAATAHPTRSSTCWPRSAAASRSATRPRPRCSGIELRSLELELSGTIDLRVFLGLDEGHAGYERIEVDRARRERRRRRRAPAAPRARGQDLAGRQHDPASRRARGAPGPGLGRDLRQLVVAQLLRR